MGQVVGGVCQSGWGRLLSVTNAQMPLKLALGLRGTVAGHRLGALEGGGYLPQFQCTPSWGAGMYWKRKDLRGRPRSGKTGGWRMLPKRFVTPRRAGEWTWQRTATAQCNECPAKRIAHVPAVRGPVLRLGLGQKARDLEGENNSIWGGCASDVGAQSCRRCNRVWQVDCRVLLAGGGIRGGAQAQTAPSPPLICAQCKHTLLR